MCVHKYAFARLYLTDLKPHDNRTPQLSLKCVYHSAADCYKNYFRLLCFLFVFTPTQTPYPPPLQALLMGVSVLRNPTPLTIEVTITG